MAIQINEYDCQVEGRHINERIDHETRVELKRITQEKLQVGKELRKLLIDRAVVQRSDMKSGEGQ